MKVFISADIEGVAGIAHSDEANPSRAEIKPFQRQMTKEVAACAQAAMAKGATEVWVKDAHWTGRNIDHAELPHGVRLIRGWSGHPYSMMQELDRSFAAAIFIGYHSRAGSGANPLAHTMSGKVVHEIKLNGVSASELLINQFICGYENVPTVLVSGDQALCDEAKAFIPQMKTVATFDGRGPSVIAKHPGQCIDEIYHATERALSREVIEACRVSMPDEFVCDVDFKDVKLAYGRSFYPGAELKTESVVTYASKDYFEILRFIQFMVG